MEAAHTLNIHKELLLEKIRHAEIGSDIEIKTPYGYSPLTYADYTASARALSFIEDYIHHTILPIYANTHSDGSWSSIQTNRFREEARQIIKNSVNANKQDAVIFSGNGVTACINLLIKAMKLEETKCVIFISKMEHNSNLIPWRELKQTIEVVDMNQEGSLDFEHLENLLQKYEHSPEMKIGSFSAASNLNGLFWNTDRLAALLHLYGAIALFDYACAGPYLKINMNGLSGYTDNNIHFGKESLLSPKMAYKDGIFISPHKFVGGPDSSGVMIIKKKLISSPVPVNPGGGTVFCVNDKSHVYLQEIEKREEGGTPNIVADIRAGLAFKLKNDITEEYIMLKEEQILNKVIPALSKIPNIVLLGNYNLHRIPIILFNIKSHGKFLHFNFVSILLNDLFGIQVRGGCSCAPLYGLHLMGCDFGLQQRYKPAVEENELLRIGYVRLNFIYFIDDESINYILEGLDFVCRYGWVFLPLYLQNPPSDVWHHQDSNYDEQSLKLNDINFENHDFFSNTFKSFKVAQVPKRILYKACIERAYIRLNSLLKQYKKGDYSVPGSLQSELSEPSIDPKFNDLIFYLRTGDVLKDLRSPDPIESIDNSKLLGPLFPKQYPMEAILWKQYSSVTEQDLFNRKSRSRVIRINDSQEYATNILPRIKSGQNGLPRGITTERNRKMSNSPDAHINFNSNHNDLYRSIDYTNSSKSLKRNTNKTTLGPYPDFQKRNKSIEKVQNSFASHQLIKINEIDQCKNCLTQKPPVYKRFSSCNPTCFLQLCSTCLYNSLHQQRQSDSLRCPVCKSIIAKNELLGLNLKSNGMIYSKNRKIVLGQLNKVQSKKFHL